MKHLILPSILFTVIFFGSKSVYARSEIKLLPAHGHAIMWTKINGTSTAELIRTISLDESTRENDTPFLKHSESPIKIVDGLYCEFPASTLMTFLEPKKDADANMITVRKYYECLFKLGDFKTLSTLIAEGAVYSQAEGLPYGGTYIGFTEWIKMFTMAGNLFDLKIEEEPTYFSNPEGDGIIIRFTIQCTAKKSGKIISMPIAEHFELTNGKITSIRPFYFDTQKFADFLK